MFKRQQNLIENSVSNNYISLNPHVEVLVPAHVLHKSFTTRVAESSNVGGFILKTHFTLQCYVSS